MWCYHDDLGRYEIGSRKNLADAEHKARLKCAATNRSRFRCGCRNDIVLWLIPVKLPGDRFILRRLRESDPHEKGCFAEKLEQIFEHREIVYTDRMLMDDEEGQCILRAGNSGRGSGSNNSSYEDLVHFFQAHFTRASLESFRAVNAGKCFKDLGLVNPTQSVVFQRLAEICHEPLLFRSTVSLASALGSLGHELFWGVTALQLVEESDNPLAEDEVLEFTIGRHWDCQGFQPTHAVLHISPKILAESRGKAKAMNHTIPGPYLYAALVKRSGATYRVLRLFRVPVCLKHGCIFMVESEVERRSIIGILGDRIALIKLQVKADLRALGSGLWPFKTDEMGRIPNRPDVIAFIGSKVRIIFITDSADAAYLSGVDKSISELEEFLGSHQVQVAKITADEFSNGSWRMRLA
jgi:hypothetical protein